MKVSYRLFLGYAVLGLLTVSEARGDDPPAPPAVSQFAPADDLVALTEHYVAQCEKALADPAQWEATQPLVKRDGATLVAVALALGLHDGPHPLKSSAAAVYAAAQKMASSGDHAAAAAALVDVHKALADVPPSAEPLDWNRKHASMGQLMKQVTFVYNRIKRGTRPDRLAKQQEEICRQATLLAVIAQTVNSDTHEVKNPDDTPKWFEMCGEMRDRSAELRAAAATGNAETTAAALERLDQSCTRCHEVFRPEQR